jgi:uncharacterized protein (DUF58 family)
MTTTAAPRPVSLRHVSDPPRSKRPRAIRNLRITFSGVLCCIIVALVGLAALNGEANLLFLLFAISMGALAYSMLAPVRAVRGISAERSVPQVAIAGRTFALTYTVRNARSWFSAWSLVVTETPIGDEGPLFPRGFVSLLGPGREQRVELTGRCTRRGLYNLKGIRVTSRFPFGLFTCWVDRPAPCELVVYPAMGRFRRDPWRERPSVHTRTTHVLRERGAQDEFYGVREYREGDSHRFIHWRRSARTGQLVVREMMDVRRTQLVVLVDPWPRPPDTPVAESPHPSAGDEDEAERVIQAAATAVCDGLERGHRVGMICRSDMPIVVAPAGGRPHRQRLLHQLALLEPGNPVGLDDLVARIRWASGWQHTRCLICAASLDVTHDRLVRLLAGRTEATLVLSPRLEGFDALFDTSYRPEAGGRTR